MVNDLRSFNMFKALFLVFIIDVKTVDSGHTAPWRCYAPPWPGVLSMYFAALYSCKALYEAALLPPVNSSICGVLTHKTIMLSSSIFIEYGGKFPHGEEEL